MLQATGDAERVQATVRDGGTFLTIREVAAKLGVSERRVRALIQAGRLKAQRAGWTWLIRPKDLAAVRTRRPGRPPKTGALA